ncbi:MAG: PAS domain S-box protein [Candidatus Goldbacteria bacterium]|nr:PAS domain S-box protein [Candidatus Goldiibacteriota bacterium]
MEGQETNRGIILSRIYNLSQSVRHAKISDAQVLKEDLEALVEQCEEGRMFRVQSMAREAAAIAEKVARNPSAAEMNCFLVLEGMLEKMKEVSFGERAEYNPNEVSGLASSLMRNIKYSLNELSHISGNSNSDMSTAVMAAEWILDRAFENKISYGSERWKDIFELLRETYGKKTGTFRTAVQSSIDGEYRSDITKAVDRINTKLKKINENLSKEKDRTVSIIESMGDAVIAVNKETKTVTMNREAEELISARSGIMFNELAGKLKNELMTDQFIKVMQSGKKIKEEITIRKSGEIRTFICIFAPMKGAGVKLAGCVAVLHEITDKKKMEEMKNEFMSMVAHELRTPLTPILLYSDLMIKRNPSPEKIREYASVIYRETKRLGALINDVLDLSRIESGRGLVGSFETADVSEILRETALMYMNASDKHKIVISGCEKEVTVEIDRAKITQVIINLVSNAIKYSPKGGEVKVQLKENKDSFIISVADEGIGISGENCKKLFQKFFRVEDGAGGIISGAGIGLAISKKIIELHGGEIKVKSIPGKGSEFSFQVPKIRKGGNSNG